MMIRNDAENIYIMSYIYMWDLGSLDFYYGQDT